MTINVFFIDDAFVKHTWSRPILEAANVRIQQSGSDLEFIEYFTKILADRDSNFDSLSEAERLEQVSKFAVTPEALLLALETASKSPTVFFSDLELTRKDDRKEQSSKFETMLLEHREGWGKRTVAEFQKLTANDQGVRLVAEEHSMTVLFLVAAKLLQIPTFIISTQVLGYQIEAIVRSGLANRPFSFAWQAYGQDDSDKQRADNWAGALVGVFDPFNCIRMVCADWFTSSSADTAIPHNYFNLSSDSRQVHRKTILTAFPWIPADCTWWNSTESAAALHDCLKDTVGGHANWMSGQGRGLPLGGAYFVFLLALSRRLPDQLHKFMIEDWRCFLKPQEGPFSFLPEQPKELAEKTIRSLYELFSAIVVHDKEGLPGVTGAIWPTPESPCFKLKLAWERNDVIDFAKNFNEVIEGLVASFGTGATSSKARLSEERTSGAFLKFSALSLARNMGAGATGGIRITQSGNLEVGSWMR